MEYTAIAEWLNTTFAGYDSAILGFMNTLATAAGGFLTPLMKLITFLGEKGIVMFLLAIGFMCFSRTRRIGVCMFGAVCCGALITNIILKDMVARPRPFEYMAVYKQYWDLIGSPAESGYSFPSGHVTAATAGMTALCFTRGKKMILPTVIVVLLMGISRNYLMAHFPSDVLFAVIIGVLSAFIAYLITKAIFNYLEDNDDFPFCAAILEFDLPVRLPDLSALTGKGAKRSGGRASGRTDTRHAEADGGRTGARSGRGGSSGGFMAALQNAASAGGELLSKAGKAMPKRGRDGARPAERPARGAKQEASDWNSRWENYRSAKDGTARTVRPAPVRADDDISGFDAPPVRAKAAPAADEAQDDGSSAFSFDEDADMKIAPAPRAKKDAEDDLFAADIPAATPAPAREVSDDGIDWASLGIDLSSIDLTAEDEEEQPVRRRRSDASRASGSRGGGYRGRHER